MKFHFDFDVEGKGWGGCFRAEVCHLQSSYMENFCLLYVTEMAREEK